MKKTVLLFFILISLQEAVAQDFREAFIISSENDTVIGLADFKENASVYRFVKFKKAGTNNTVEYRSHDIKVYGFKNDRYFESMDIPADSGKTQKVFCEVLVKGAVSLYRFEKIYYVQKRGGTFYALIDKKKDVIIDGIKYRRSLDEHRSILTMLMSDCPALNVGKKEIDLKQKVLVKLCVDYNTCQGEPVVEFKERKPFLKFSPALATGVAITQFKSTEYYPYFYFHIEGTYKGSTATQLGLLFDLSSPRVHERLSLYLGILAAQHSYTLTTVRDYEQIAGVIERNYVNLELTEAKIPITIKYSFPERFLTPYIFAGTSATLNLKTKSSWRKELEYSPDNITRIQKEAPVIFKKHQAGFLAGIGTTVKLYKHIKIFTEARYELTNGLVKQPNDGYHTSLRNVQFLVGLKF